MKHQKNQLPDPKPKTQKNIRNPKRAREKEQDLGRADQQVRIEKDPLEARIDLVQGLTHDYKARSPIRSHSKYKTKLPTRVRTVYLTSKSQSKRRRRCLLLIGVRPRS